MVGGPCSFQTLSPGPVSVTNIVFFLGQMVVVLIRWSNRCVVYGLKGVCGPYFMASCGLLVSCGARLLPVWRLAFLMCVSSCKRTEYVFLNFVRLFSNRCFAMFLAFILRAPVSQ